MSHVNGGTLEPMTVTHSADKGAGRESMHGLDICDMQPERYTYDALFIPACSGCAHREHTEGALQLSSQ